MLELLDQQKSLTINQWKIFVASVFTIMLDFFDFGLIAFTLAFFVSDWHLTFGQSAAILFSSGIASVPAGIFFGWLGDRIGRRRVFMITILTFSLATGLMAVTLGGWIFLPQATVDAIVPVFNYFAVWFLLPVFVFLFIGIETKGRTIEELDAALTGPVPAKAAAR